MRYGLFFAVVLGVAAMFGFSYAEDLDKAVSAENQPAVSNEITKEFAANPVAENKIDPTRAYIMNSKEAWREYRIALRTAQKNLIQSLELADTNLKDDLKSLRADAREAIHNTPVKDVCEVGRLKWRETLALSGKAFEEARRAKYMAWQSYGEVRKQARAARNSALEALRGNLKDSK